MGPKESPDATAPRAIEPGFTDLRTSKERMLNNPSATQTRVTLDMVRCSVPSQSLSVPQIAQKWPPTNPIRNCQPPTAEYYRPILPSAWPELRNLAGQMQETSRFAGGIVYLICDHTASPLHPVLGRQRRRHAYNLCTAKYYTYQGSANKIKFLYAMVQTQSRPSLPRKDKTETRSAGLRQRQCGLITKTVSCLWRRMGLYDRTPIETLHYPGFHLSQPTTTTEDADIGRG